MELLISEDDVKYFLYKSDHLLIQLQKVRDKFNFLRVLLLGNEDI